MSSSILSQSQEIYLFLKKLSNLNLTSTIYALMRDCEKCEWTDEQATQAVTHYMMFLLLIQCYPHIRLTPTWEIDRVWYQHIQSDTDRYERDCQMLFGCMAHHISNLGYYEDWQNKYDDKSFKTTIFLFKKHFKVVLKPHSTVCKYFRHYRSRSSVVSKNNCHFLIMINCSKS
jgi:hypothetical protein